MVFIHATVRKNKDIGTFTKCLVNLYEQTVNSTFQLCALVI